MLREVREVPMQMFFKFNSENKRFESQSKLQMFPLVSGRHVGVPLTGYNMASPY